MERVNWKMVALVMGLVLAVGAVFGVAKLVDSNHRGEGERIEDMAMLNTAIRVEYSLFSEPQQLILEPAKVYLEKNGEVSLETLKQNYRYEVDRLDEGLPVRISYEVKGMPEGCSVSTAVLEVAEDAQFSAPRHFTMSEDRCYADVYLLKANTKYYFRIQLTLSNGASTGVSGDFTTADTPRLLSLDGAVNVRDIGGRTTVDGSTVRQGLLYRGSELDGAVNPDYRLSAIGAEHMLHVLKVRTRMDLRGPVEAAAGDPLGDSVRLVTVAAPKYADAFADGNAAALKQIFAELAKANRYPIYMHDTDGTDQVGTVVYLLEAVLGMAEEDLNREYRASILCHKSLPGTDMNNFLAALDGLNGANRQEKAENYLLSIGVSEAELDAIRDIFLEPPTAAE